VKLIRPSKSLALFWALLTPAVIAQDLRLFEEPERDPAEQAAPAPEQAFMTPTNGQPAYTLRSVSRFGDQYQAVLIDRGGQAVKVMWNEGETASVPNSGFTIAAAGSASTVSLMHPAGDSCISSELVGVSCSAANRSELRLAPAAPLASNGAPPVGVMPQQANQGFFGAAPMGPQYNGDPAALAAMQQAAAQNGQQVFLNPFSGQPEVMPQVSPEEQAARQQRQELRAARLRQFEQQRIEDADIPPGMQRVRTPFGDQLMPIRD
jgi:hypothetical protein